MYDLNNRSLELIREDPLFLKLDAGRHSVYIKDFQKNLQKIHALPQTCPVQEITKFYLIDQCFFILQSKYGLKQNLPVEEFETAQMLKKEMVLTCNRVFYFLITACLSEIGRFPIVNQNPTLFDYLRQGYGTEFGDAVENLNKGKNGYQGSLDLDTLSNMQLEKMIAGMVAVFSSGKWHFGAGGTGWGNIAKAANHFLRGNLSLHETIDLAFSLCHDRGSYFDRVGWGGPSSFKNNLGLDKLYTILDVQASGQIPQFVKTHPEYLNAQGKRIFNIFALTDPKIFGAPVNHSLIQNSTKKREEKLKIQWAASQAHHTQIQNITQQKKEEAAKNPPVAAIDKILISDYKNGLL